MYLPNIDYRQGTTMPTTTFYGLNRALVTQEGELADMRNLCSDHYPIISTRPRRHLAAFPGAQDGIAHPTDPMGMLATDRLITIDGGAVYVDGVQQQGIQLSTEPAMLPKHMVTMGAYVCIWPDKKYINLANPDDCGDMGASWQGTSDTVISASMTRKDGRDYDLTDVTIGDTAPAEPVDKQLWIDTSSGVDQLMQYSVIYGEWIQVATTYIKLQATGIGADFREGDVIFLEGVTQAGEEDEAATAAQESEDITIPVEGSFNLNSSFNTTHMGGTTWVSSTPTIAERTKTITVEGIPEGAAVLGAKLIFTAGSSLYGARLQTVNGISFTAGSNEIPVTVTGNGEHSFLFRFQSGNNATVSGAHSGSVKISDMSLVVTWATTGATDEQIRSQLQALNTSCIIYGAGDDYIIVAGMLRRSVTISSAMTAELRIPDFDYVTESSNRLWGCSYSRTDGVLTNEIRACALGDFRNWHSFQGTSMDSYAVSIGSEGRFTGAANIAGQPVFFKENTLHRISGTEPASFTLNTAQCKGVQEGCWRSLALVNGVLYYKARTDVMAYDGSIPYPIGEKLGGGTWYEAAGAGYSDKYYLSMHDDRMQWGMYVYDTAKRLWHKEDADQVRYMATAGGVLYHIHEGTNGNTMYATGAAQGTVEDPFDWSVTFGVFGVTDPNQKYISRFNIRAALEAGTEMALQIQYDSDGVWHDMGSMQTPVLRTFLLPVVPRRCDHLQVRINGKGGARIYSISRTYYSGGDGGYGPVSKSADA